MGNTMLLCALLTILLPMTTTEDTSVPRDEETMHPTQGQPETATDGSSPIYTKEINHSTIKTMELLSMTTTSPASITQNQTIANLEDITVTTPENVEASAIYNNETATLVEGFDFQTYDSAITQSQNIEVSTRAITSTPSEISTWILSTSSDKISSTQNSAMKTETPKSVLPTERFSTIAVPTAKLSATTQFVPSVKITPNLVMTTKEGKTTALVPRVKLSTATQLDQKNTVKLTETTKMLYSTVVTKGHATTSSNTEGATTMRGLKHGKVVAGLIGAALIAMMIGFLVICYKKHKLKKHQIATTEWAGPTPFLEAGGGDSADKGNVTLRSANRISLTGFLPQRLSKRLSLLAESDEMQDMQEMTTGTTFVPNEEKSGTKSDQSLEKSVKEANENNSESSVKTQEVTLVDETKGNEGETGKDKQNGEAVMKDGEKGEKGDLENVSTLLAPKEDAPTESMDQDKNENEKDEMEKVG